jgi:hypothetical protein
MHRICRILVHKLCHVHAKLDLILSYRSINYVYLKICCPRIFGSKKDVVCIQFGIVCELYRLPGSVNIKKFMRL